jgi:PAS domain S-box-containing protein
MAPSVKMRGNARARKHMNGWSSERKTLTGFAGAMAIALCAMACVAAIRASLLAPLISARLVYGSLAFAAAMLIAALGRLLRRIYLGIATQANVEQRLQDANRFLESLLDNIPTMIFAKEAKNLTFLHFNRAGENLLGYSRADLLGKSDRDFFPPEQVEFFIGKDREVLARGDVLDIPEEEIDTRLGRRILHTRKVPVRDENGRPALLLGISMDITEQKANERRMLALNEELQRHAALLESSNQELESFCYSVSHDLRSPLRAINGYARLLQQQHATRLDEEGIRYLRTICNASERMSRLIDDLLEFSRLGRQSLTTAAIDMGALVGKAIEDVLEQRPTPHPAIEVKDLLPAQGDRRMLHLVWLNLLDNAVKYSGGAADAAIRIHCRENGREIHYSVTDNGIGFDMRDADKLFGVFQRLHGVDEFPGTGVGLAIVQRILARHGGRAWAQSAPGQGATFHFSLPSTPNAAAQ